MFVPRRVLLVPALLVSAFAIGVTGPAAAQGEQKWNTPEGCQWALDTVQR